MADSAPLSKTDSAPLNTTDSAPLSKSDSAPLNTTDSAPLSKSDSAPLSKSDSAPLNTTDSAPLSKSDSAPLSKSAKRNKKRHNKKYHSKDVQVGHKTSAGELLIALKHQLEIAKQNKDHKLAGTLRQQIWVVTDIYNGVTPNLPDDELQDIMKDLPLGLPGENKNSKPRPSAPNPPASQDVGLTPSQSKLLTMRKKLEQIKLLKERRDNGEKLQANQLSKIDTEESLKEEIDELEDLLGGMIV